MRGPSGPAGPAAELAEAAVAVAVRLRACGLPVGLRSVAAFTRALDVCFRTPGSFTPGRLYWAARITLVDDHRRLAAFDRVFAEIAEGLTETVPRLAALAPAPVGTAPGQRAAAAARAADGSDGLPWATRPQPVDEAADAPADPRLVGLADLLPAAETARTETPFQGLDPETLRRLADLLRAAQRHWPVRRTRREQRSAHGQVTLRATMAAARRTGWEPVRLERRRPTTEPRRIVALCDVSESMQADSTAYLHLLRAIARERGNEVFAFSTRLTRLTPALARMAPDKAVELATARVTDRFGGTRIAGSLRTLLHSPYGNLLRGAICLIASDGWDSDPPEELARQLARLHRRAHRVVWLNPRAAEPGYQPLAGGMAAALPYCDAFLPARRVEEMAEVFAAATAPSHRATATASRTPKGGTV